MLAVGMLWWAGGAAAQLTPQQGGYEPVEQLIDDRDPLQASLRIVEPGLRAEGGQGTFVFRRPDLSQPGQDKLFFITPGMVAEYDRSDYGLFEVERDEFRVFQLIAPNTVFHIGFPPEEEAPPPPPEPPLRRQLRVDGRLYASADARVDEDRAVISTSRQEWVHYQQFRAAQQQFVLKALDALNEPQGQTQPAPADRTE